MSKYHIVGNLMHWLVEHFQLNQYRDHAEITERDRSLEQMHETKDSSLCMLGNLYAFQSSIAFYIFCSQLLHFISFFMMHEYHQSVKQCGPKSGLAFCRACSGVKLLAQISSETTQAGKESINQSALHIVSEHTTYI